MSEPKISIELSTNNFAYRLLELEIEDLIKTNDQLNHIIQTQKTEIEQLRKSNTQMCTLCSNNTENDPEYADFISIREFIRKYKPLDK
jgi:FtsZ-binding cell division protein ZapB